MGPLLLLLLLAFVVFREGMNHQFTNWDDGQYIVGNPLVHGFSSERVWMAFTHFHVFNYNPLHLISYMLDYELWGLKAGGFFLTSLLLHVCTGVLIYYLALHWLESPPAALAVAALFLVHPTRVESVAWLSERKDVLSGCFAAASLLAYARQLDAERIGLRRALFLASWLLFLLALLSKTQLVTLPIILLSMDLCRRRPFWHSLLWKVPFFILSGVFSAITIRAHSGESAAGLDFPESLLGPLSALPRYLLHLLWPFGLSPYYDYPPGTFHGALPVAAGLVLVLLLAACAWRSYRGQRVWFLGIVWPLALLAPASGVFRINICLADRYLYLAIVGPVLALASVALRSRRYRSILGVATAVLVVLLAFETTTYLQAFQDSESLWSRVLEQDPGSSMAHSNLGDHLRVEGRLAEAAAHYDADLAQAPCFEGSFLGRALVHDELGDREGARRVYDLLLAKRPHSLAARLEYARFLEWVNERQAALKVLLDLTPPPASAAYYQLLHHLHRGLNQRGEALAAARRACEISPYDPSLQDQLRRAEEEVRRHEMDTAN